MTDKEIITEHAMKLGYEIIDLINSKKNILPTNHFLLTNILLNACKGLLGKIMYEYMKDPINQLQNILKIYEEDIEQYLLMRRKHENEKKH